LRKFLPKPFRQWADNVLVDAMAVICGLALVAFACMATSGLDMSAGFF
jgi:hypothetical protein